MYKNDKVIRQYSESFKLKILDELTTGKLNKYQLGKAYGIVSSTIDELVMKYNRKNLMNTRVTVKTKDKITRIKQLQKEIEQLKRLLLKKDMDVLIDESYLEVAAEQLGYKSFMELKKTKYQALIRARERSKGLAYLAIICNCLGLKRDAYYKYKHRADRRLDIERKIIEIVKRGRKSLSKEGVRKLKISLKNEFDKATLKVGRDMPFNILRKHNMLITRKKPSYRTTNSLHRF